MLTPPSPARPYAQRPRPASCPGPLSGFVRRPPPGGRAGCHPFGTPDPAATGNDKSGRRRQQNTPMTPSRGEQPMTANQASPARTGLPAPRAATARPHDPAGHPAIGRRPADLLLMAARKKTALYAPLLLGGAAAAVLALAWPAMASPVTGQAAAGTMSISPIFGNGDIVTGVRGTTDGNVIVTGSHATAGSTNTLPFL